MTIKYKIDKELEEIVPAFMESRRKDIDLLSKFISENNYEELRSIGHKIKGTAGSYEFFELSEIGRKIEKCAGDKDHIELEKLINEYESHVEQIAIEYI